MKAFSHTASTLVIATCFACSTAYAQGSGAASASGADETDQSASQTAGLEEIVVVARKVSENLQDVPVSVTAFSGDSLEQQNATRVADIARLTPGLNIKAASSTATAININLRGQYQADILATLDPSVGVYVDGYYWARAYGLNTDLLDVASAQILKGPQGTLFGRNTTGGALLLQTKDPSFAGVSGHVSATYGRFDERNGTAVLNLPLVTDRVALRGAFSVTKRDGYVRNTVTGRDLGELDSYTGRAKLLVQATDNLSLLLSGEIYKTDSYTRPYRLGYFSPTGLAATEAGIELYGAPTATEGTAFRTAQGAAFFASYVPTAGGDTVRLNEDPRSIAKTQTYTGTLNLDTFFGGVKFIGGYRKVTASASLDLDGSPIAIVRTLGQQDLEQYSGEFQITGKALDNKLDFVFGAFAFREDGVDKSESVNLPALSTLGGRVLTRSINEGLVATDSLGLYGQANWHVTGNLSASAGLRYSVEDKGLESRNRVVIDATGALVSCSFVGANPATCGTRRKDDFSGLSYHFGLDYTLDDGTLLYVKTEKGFRSGGQNLRAATTVAFVPFKPEIVRSYEAGVKAEFFDRRVRFNLAGYYSEVSDIQRTTLLVATLPGGTTSTSTIVGNAGKARIWGGEAELSAMLFDGFTVNGTLGLTKPKYLEYASAGTDRRAERFEQVPEWTFSLAATYTRDLDFGRLLLRADYSWQDDTPLASALNLLALAPNSTLGAIDPAYVAATTQPAGGVLNARASLGFADDRFELALFGRNLTNRQEINNSLTFALPLGALAQQTREPRTFGVTGTWRFGER